MNVLKIAIISDLHCKHGGLNGSDDTWLLSERMRLPNKQHPIQALINLIENEKLNADLLICPGDITNKTDPQGLVTGWSFLEEIKSHLNANYLIASLGNHDVDSRGLHNKYDHLDMPRKLKDNFPFEFSDAKKAYIADRYCFIKFDDILIFNFNSVHSHTNAGSSLESIISDDILEMIEDDLKKIPENQYKFKIGITHHHPIKHSNVGFIYKDNDVIEKGEKLIELLDRFDFQIFIHGHKHEPKLTNYNNLPVFASGSFSSIMNLRETGSSNCFHLIELQGDTKKGTIYNWEYTFGLGWDVANSKLRSKSGFGHHCNINEFSKSIKAYFNDENLKRLSDKEFHEIFPDFIYLIPSDQDKVFSSLKETLDFIYDHSTGMLKEVIKRK